MIEPEFSNYSNIPGTNSRKYLQIILTQFYTIRIGIEIVISSILVVYIVGLSDTTIYQGLLSSKKRTLWAIIL